MATIVFNVPTDVLGQALFDNFDVVDVLSVSATAIDIGIPPTGPKLLSLYGSFQFSGDELSGGTLTGLRTYLLDGSVEVDASGFSLDLLYLVELLLTNPDPFALEQAIMGGNDLLVGSTGADDLSAYGGNDTIDGGAGIDTMAGDGGNDTYHVRDVGDRVVESDPSILSGGRDTVLSYLSSYTLPANVEAGRIMAGIGAKLVGNGLANELTGGAGSDTLIGGKGNDRLDGGAGIDTADLSDAASGVVINLALATNPSTGGLGSDTLVSIENVFGSGFGDQLTGNAGANRLIGAKGADTLEGGGGVDTLVGGNGGDTYVLRETFDVISETNAEPAGGVDTVLSYLSSYTLGTNIENARAMLAGATNLTGNGLSNVLVAGAGSNVLAGGGGIDTVDYGPAAAGVTVSLAVTTAQATGGSGSDTLTSIEGLRGSAFADRLTGSSGANTIKAGGGNDKIIGGGGNDTLQGGGGADTFRFASPLSGTGNVDTLSDFASGTDRIELENAFFPKFTANGTLPAGTFRANLTGTAVDANDYLVYETDTGKLFYDADGSGAGAAVQIAVLTGAPTLVAADFWIT